MPDPNVSQSVRRWQDIEAAAREVVGHADEARRVFAGELIEGAIVLRPETFYALKDALDA